MAKQRMLGKRSRGKTLGFILLALLLLSAAASIFVSILPLVKSAPAQQASSDPEKLLADFIKSAFETFGMGASPLGGYGPTGDGEGGDPPAPEVKWFGNPYYTDTTPLMDQGANSSMTLYHTSIFAIDNSTTPVNNMTFLPIITDFVPTTYWNGTGQYWNESYVLNENNFVNFIYEWNATTEMWKLSIEGTSQSAATKQVQLNSSGIYSLNDTCVVFTSGIYFDWSDASSFISRASNTSDTVILDIKLPNGEFMIDPIFGNDETTAPNTDIPNVIRGNVHNFTASGENVALSISVYLASSYDTSNAKVKCAIYDYSDLSLVASTEEREFVFTTSPAWYTFAFTTPPSLTQYTNYTLVIWANASGTGYVTQIGLASESGAITQYQTIVYTGTFPDPLVPTNSSDWVHTMYCTYSAGPPTIGTINSSPSVYANKYFFVNYTINSPDGNSYFENSTLTICNGTSPASFLWNGQTYAFSELSDSSNYWTLDTANCLNTTVNSTAYTLSFKVKGYWNFTQGAINCNATVYNTVGESDTELGTQQTTSGYTSPTAAPSGTWSNPSYAYTDGTNYASTSTTTAVQQFGTYGFSLPSSAVSVDNIIIKYDAWTSTLPSYTETATTNLAEAGSGWQNYDIFTTNSVPKGAVAEIVCGNGNDAAALWMGIRKDGSTLERRVLLHEAEAGGNVTATFLVKVDASTGYIETYCNSTTGANFLLLGYWQGVTYTELNETWTAGTTGAWTGYNLTAKNVPTNSTAEIFITNDNNGAEATGGVRRDALAGDRYMTIHEAESATTDSTDVTGYRTFVQSNTTGYIQYYASANTIDYYVWGYFSNTTMNYVDTWVPRDVTTGGAWAGMSLSGYTYGATMLDFVLTHGAANNEYYLGVREGGSSNNRYVLVHESEANDWNGYGVTSKVNATVGQYVDFYTGSSSDDNFYLAGRFYPINPSVQVTASYDGGTSWVTAQTTYLNTSETSYTYDVGSLRTWNRTEMNDTNFRVKVTATIEAGSPEIRLDWIPVNVTYFQYYTVSTFEADVYIADSAGTVGSDKYGVVNGTAQPSYKSNARTVAMSSDGTLYACYYDSSGGNKAIFVANSTNNGETWGAGVLISTEATMSSYDQQLPSIWIDSSDDIHVVWLGGTDSSSGYGHIHYALYNGSWQTPIRVSNDSIFTYKSEDGPSVAVDSNGYVHVVWHGQASGYDQFQIWYKVYNGSWQSAERLSTTSSLAFNAPSIAIDSNDYLHVVYYYSGGYGIYYSLNNGSWQTPVNISTYSGMDSAYQVYPSISIDQNDYLHVAWHGLATGYTGNNYQIWHAINNGSWQTPVRVSNYTGMDTNRQNHATISSFYDVSYIVWQGNATGYSTTNYVWYSASNGESFTTPTYITNGSVPTIMYPTSEFDGMHFTYFGESEAVVSMGGTGMHFIANYSLQPKPSPDNCTLIASPSSGMVSTNFNVSGYVFYHGTMTPVEDTTGLNITAVLTDATGAYRASTATLNSSGGFNITITSEGTAADWDYWIYVNQSSATSSNIRNSTNWGFAEYTVTSGEYYGRTVTTTMITTSSTAKLGSHARAITTSLTFTVTEYRTFNGTRWVFDFSGNLTGGRMSTPTSRYGTENIIIGTPYCSPFSGTTSIMSVYLSESSSTSSVFKVKCAIYYFDSDDDLIAETEELIIDPTTSWQLYNFSFPSPVSIDSGRKYMLAVWSNTSASTIFGAGAVTTSAQANYTMYYYGNGPTTYTGTYPSYWQSAEGWYWNTISPCMYLNISISNGGLAITESESKQLTYGRLPSDSLLFTTTPYRLANCMRTTSASLTFTVTVYRLQLLSRAESDQLAFDADAYSQLTYSRIPSDALSLSSPVSRLLVGNRTMVSALGSTNIEYRTFNGTRELNEGSAGGSGEAEPETTLIGTNTVGNYSYGSLGGRLYAFGWKAPQNGTIQNISIIIYEGSSTSTVFKVKMALYDATGNLIEDTNEQELDITTSYVWYNFTLETEQTVVADTFYHLVCWTNASTSTEIRTRVYQYYYNCPDGDWAFGTLYSYSSCWATYSYTGSFPSAFPSNTTNAYTASVYANISYTDYRFGSYNWTSLSTNMADYPNYLFGRNFTSPTAGNMTAICFDYSELLEYGYFNVTAGIYRASDNSSLGQTEFNAVNVTANAHNIVKLHFDTPVEIEADTEYFLVGFNNGTASGIRIIYDVGYTPETNETNFYLSHNWASNDGVMPESCSGYVHNASSLNRGVYDHKIWAEVDVEDGGGGDGIAGLLITESPSKTMIFGRLPTDAVLLTIAPLRIIDANRISNDPLGSSEDALRKQAIGRMDSDPLDVDDATYRVMIFGRIESDSIESTDQASRKLSLMRQCAESLEFTVTVQRGMMMYYGALYESLTQSESVSRRQSSRRTANDPLGADEAAQRKQALGRLQSDPLDVGESIEATYTNYGMLYTRTLSDSLDTTAALYRQVDADRTANDPLGTDESAIRKQLLGRLESDPLNVTMVIYSTYYHSGVAYTRTLSDSIESTDATIRATVAGRTANDPLSTDEAAQRKQALGRLQSDPLDANESIEATYTNIGNTFTRTLDDSIAAGDEAMRAFAGTRVANDPLGTDESAIRKQLLGRLESDPLTVDETVYSTYFHSGVTYTRVLSDSVESADVTIRVIVAGRVANDPLGTDEAAVRKQQIGRLESDPLTVSESIEATYTNIGNSYTRTLSDNLAAAEATLRKLDADRVANDPLGTDEAAQRKQALGRLESDPLNTDESIEATYTNIGNTYDRSLDDSLASSDSISKKSYFPRTANDPLGTNEAAQRKQALGRLESDPLDATESIEATYTNVGNTYTRALDDSLAAAESPSRAVSASRVANDPLGTDEAAQRKQALGRLQSDPLDVDETVVGIYTHIANSYTRTLTDSLESTDATSRKFTGARVANDPLGMDEAAQRKQLLGRLYSEVLDVAEDVEGTYINVGNSYTRELGDSLLESESITKSMYAPRVANDPLGTSEEAQRKQSLGRLESDPLTATESIEATFINVGNTFVRTLSDTLAAAEAAMRKLDADRVANDPLGTDESAIRKQALGRLYSEALTADHTVVGIFTNVGNMFTRELADAMESAESTVRQFAGARVANDPLGTSEDAIRKQLLGRLYSEIMETAESIEATYSYGGIVYTRTLSDSIGATDQAGRVGAFGRAVGSALEFTTAVYRQFTTAVPIIRTFTANPDELFPANTFQIYCSIESGTELENATITFTSLNNITVVWFHANDSFVLMNDTSYMSVSNGSSDHHHDGVETHLTFIIKTMDNHPVRDVNATVVAYDQSEAEGSASAAPLYSVVEVPTDVSLPVMPPLMWVALFGGGLVLLMLSFGSNRLMLLLPFAFLLHIASAFTSFAVADWIFEAGGWVHFIGMSPLFYVCIGLAVFDLVVFIIRLMAQTTGDDGEYYD